MARKYTDNTIEHPEFSKNIGHLCAAWSHLEYITDRILWRVLKVNSRIGSMLTSSKDLGGRWNLIVNNAEPFVDEIEFSFFQKINTLIATVAIDRNIAVHGQILIHRDTREAFAVVTRGKYADKLNCIDLKKIQTVTVNIQLLSQVAESIARSHRWMVKEPDGEVNEDWAKPIEGFP